MKWDREKISGPLWRVRRNGILLFRFSPNTQVRKKEQCKRSDTKHAMSIYIYNHLSRLQSTPGALQELLTYTLLCVYIFIYIWLERDTIYIQYYEERKGANRMCI